MTPNAPIPLLLVNGEHEVDAVESRLVANSPITGCLCSVSGAWTSRQLLTPLIALTRMSMEDAHPIGHVAAERHCQPTGDDGGLDGSGSSLLMAGFALLLTTGNYMTVSKRFLHFVQDSELGIG